MYSASDIQDIKNGEPVVVDVYHGTTNDFYEFDASVKGNIEGHLGKVNYFTSDEGDAAQNYQSDGADITSRVLQETERLEDNFALEDIESLYTEKEAKKIFKVDFNEIKGLSRAERAELIAERKIIGAYRS